MKQVRYAAIGFFTILGMVASAAADETYEARITYSPGQSATQIYESLNQSIRGACEVQYRKHATTSLAHRRSIKKDCQRQLMDSAIETINMPELVALHSQSRPGHASLVFQQAAIE